MIRLLNRFVQNTDSFRKDELRVSDPFTQSIRSKHWFIQERRVTSQWSVYSIDSFKTLIHSGKTSYESVIRLLNRFVQNTDSFRKDELRLSDPFTQSIRSKHWFIQERRVTSQWSVYSIDSFKITDSFRKDELRVSDPFTQSIRSKHWFIQERRVTSQWSVYSIDSFKTLIHSGKKSYESVIRLLNRFVQNSWFIQERRVTTQWSVYSIDSFKTLIHSGKTSYDSVIRLLNQFVQITDSLSAVCLHPNVNTNTGVRPRSFLSMTTAQEVAYLDNYL